MDKFNFLKQIDELKEFIPEKKVLELYDSAEEIIGDLESDIKDSKNETSDLKDELEELKIRISEQEEEIFELQNDVSSDSKFKLYGHHENIVTEQAIERLFENLDIIPIPSLELFINQYTKS